MKDQPDGILAGLKNWT